MLNVSHGSSHSNFPGIEPMDTASAIIPILQFRKLGHQGYTCTVCFNPMQFLCQLTPIIRTFSLFLHLILYMWKSPTSRNSVVLSLHRFSP